MPFLGAALLILGAVVALAAWGAALAARDGAIADLRARLEQAARAAVDSGGVASESGGAVAIAIIGLDGVVTRSSDPFCRVGQNESDRPEVVAALRDGSGFELRHGTLTHEPDFLFVAVRGPAAIARASISLASVDGRVMRIYLQSSVLAVIGAGLLGLVSVALARRWQSAARPVIHAASELAEGEQVAQTPPERADEIGDLYRMIQKMDERRTRMLRDFESQQNDLRAILDHATDGIIVIGPSERISLMNSAARTIFDAPADATGRPFEDVNRNPKIQEFVHRVRHNEGIQQIDIALAGDTAIRLRGSRIPDPKGREGRILLIAIDISDLRRLERMRIDFVANASHELKTPLSAILGFAETLHDDASLDPETRQRFLDTILRNARRLEELVQDLLRLSRMESSGPSLRLEAVDPTELCQSVIDAYKDSADRKKIQLKLFSSQRTPVVSADRELIYQCISNLVSNAVKFTREGGYAHVQVHPAEGGVRIEVSDNGPGIASDQIHRVFERFYRADAARTREEGGTGLGLAIAKHAVLLHGGTIEVESELGRGSRFKVFLPEVPPA